MARTSIYPSFRSDARKTTPARFLKDADGFYTYTCSRCGKALRFRRRQPHPHCLLFCFRAIPCGEEEAAD